MYRFPVGVIVDSFRLPMAEAVKKAKEVGAQGIQVYASHGDMAPENMTPQKISEFRKLVSDNGLVISALCGDLGGGGFVHPDRNPEKVEKSKRILDLAKELGTDIVTTHIGVVPADSENERYKIMQQACFELSSYADTIQSHFAVETGPEKSIILKNFLDSLNSRGVGNIFLIITILAARWDGRTDIQTHWQMSEKCAIIIHLAMKCLKNLLPHHHFLRESLIGRH